MNNHYNDIADQYTSKKIVQSRDKKIEVSYRNSINYHDPPKNFFSADCSECDPSSLVSPLFTTIDNGESRYGIDVFDFTSQSLSLQSQYCLVTHSLMKIHIESCPGCIECIDFQDPRPRKRGRTQSYPLTKGNYTNSYNWPRAEGRSRRHSSYSFPDKPRFTFTNNSDVTEVSNNEHFKSNGCHSNQNHSPLCPSPSQQEFAEEKIDELENYNQVGDLISRDELSSNSNTFGKSRDSTSSLIESDDEIVTKIILTNTELTPLTCENHIIQAVNLTSGDDALSKKNSITVEKSNDSTSPLMKIDCKTTDDIIPNDNDVLFGRGYHFIQHPGNQRFRKLIERKSHLYFQLKKFSKKGKKKLSLEIIASVRECGGRFLQVDNNSSPLSYREVGETEALEKCSQRFRELSRQSRKDKTKGRTKEKTDERLSPCLYPVH